jgi:hypothetical protein
MKRPDVTQTTVELRTRIKGCLTYLTNEFRPNNEPWKVPCYQEAEELVESSSLNVERMLAVAHEIDDRKRHLDKQAQPFVWLAVAIERLEKAVR